MNDESAPEGAPWTNGAKVKSTLTQPWEPSAWFRGQLARAEERARSYLPAGIATTLVIALRHAQPGSREDRTCDRCRKYVPPMSARFVVGGVRRDLSETVYAVVTFGLCEQCHQREGSPLGHRSVS